MKKSLRVFGSLVMPVCVSFACLFNTGCGDDDSPTGGQGATEFEGTWKGSPVNDPGSTFVYVIAGNTASVTIDNVETYTGTYSFDATTDPKRADFTVTQSVQSKYVGLTSLGIYKINGGVLTLASNEPGVKVRPTDFTPKSGTMVIMLNKQ